MKKINKCISFAFMALIFTTGVSSCKKKNDEPTLVTSGKYGIWLQVGSYPNTNPYVLSAQSLTQGSVSLKGNGSEVTGVADYGIIPGGEYYYYYNEPISKFSKFKLENSKLIVIKEVQLTHLASTNTFVWVDKNTLVMFGLNADASKVLYSKVNVNTLDIINGELALDPLPTGTSKYNTGSAEYSNGKFFLGLTYAAAKWSDPSDPNFHVAVLNSDFTLNKTLSDNRSVGAGQSKLWMQGSFVDESGDTYLLTSPTWINGGTSPSAIYRIKSGETEFDNSYFFNTNSSSIGYTCEAMWYVGNGIAIIRYVNTTITTSTHNTQFAAINVADGTVRKILSDLPNDTEGGLESIAVEDGKAYILVNSETGKDYIWEYNPTTNDVKPGLEISGGYDYLLRVDVLK
ncbi:DUF4374 domain-containing protein [uncultured Cytophaga sp.]|uniref:DUF4374 domain-containing protein n=1 Tax=uncultured Cytophaga sp. TaxID=160238 RepID=UPI0026159528|nr:DUF4374 domain-containing protein [uncultured Cytophaga sp.]